MVIIHLLNGMILQVRKSFHVHQLQKQLTLIKPCGPQMRKRMSRWKEVC